ncbi:MAG: hypothetical protein Q9192_006946, partial [Flavoplaca navasiana]
ITISGKQVEMATKLTKDASSQNEVAVGAPIKLGNGSVRFLELDAETMGEQFAGQSFDCIWISEAMSHLPDKELFFRNAFELLKLGGKLVIADWFKAEDLTEKQLEDDIKPIEVCLIRNMEMRSLRYQPTSVEDVGYLLVASPITLSVGLCVDARKGRDCVSAGVSGDEKRLPGDEVIASHFAFEKSGSDSKSYGVKYLTANLQFKSNTIPLDSMTVPDGYRQARRHGEVPDMARCCDAAAPADLVKLCIPNILSRSGIIS